MLVKFSITVSLVRWQGRQAKGFRSFTRSRLNICVGLIMALRSSALAATRGIRRLFFTTSAYPSLTPPPASATTAPAREQAEPSTNLFISGLNKRTTTEKLGEFASQFGEVVHARVVCDQVSGYSKGYGFVRYANLEDAAKGIQGMDGKFLEGWVIFAEYARPRPPRPPLTGNVGTPGGSPYGSQYGRQ